MPSSTSFATRQSKFFVSSAAHQLASKLQKRQMTIVGSIRKNRKEIPPILVDVKRKLASMLSYVPTRSRFVTLLSTYLLSIDISHKESEKNSEIIKYQSHTKGGFDVLDQLDGTYRFMRKVWPGVLFCNMLDISAANAFKTYIKLKPESNIEKKDVRRRLFLIELGQALCRQILPDFVRISSNKGFFRVEEFVFHIYFAI